MIIMDVQLNHIYGFDDFHMSFTYPRKLSVSLIGEEALEGRERFRFKKAVLLMGANATGKTSLGRALLKIFSSIKEANEAILRELDHTGIPARFQVDFVNEGYTLHRFAGKVDGENVSIRYLSAEIGEMAVKVHETLGLRTYSRSDFMVTEDDMVYFLEVNTLPGMTPTSLVPQEAEKVGISYADLCELIVKDAMKD